MEVWYYANADQERQGPVTAEQIKILFQRQEISEQTQLWCEGMFAWMPLGSLAKQFKLDEPPGSPEPTPTSPYPLAPRTYNSAATPIAHVPSNLLWAVLSTLLCCWPLGIVAIVYAVKVERYRSDGDLAAAREASNTALMWSLWSAGIALAIVILIALADIAFGASR